MITVLMVAVVAAVVIITLGARKVLIQIPQRTAGSRTHARGLMQLHPAAQINSSGVMPIVFAQSMIVMPAAVAKFSGIPRLNDLAGSVHAGGRLVLPALRLPDSLLHLLLHVDHLQPCGPR